MQNVKNLAERIRNIFEEKKASLGIPFFYDFPQNCCEGASCFLALILVDKFPDKRILVIHGSDKDRVENHFWIDVDGLIFDLTIDQFNSFTSPVYGELEHPLKERFPITESYFVPDFFQHYVKDCLELERSNMIYSNLKQQIKLCG